MDNQLQHQTKRRFGILDIFATQKAMEVLSRSAMITSLDRHHDGDWGDVSDLERVANEEGVLNKGPIISRFRNMDKVFTIKTSGDRQTTLISLVDDPENNNR